MHYKNYSDKERAHYWYQQGNEEVSNLYDLVAELKAEIAANARYMERVEEQAEFRREVIQVIQDRADKAEKSSRYKETKLFIKDIQIAIENSYVEL